MILIHCNINYKSILSTTGVLSPLKAVRHEWTQDPWRWKEVTCMNCKVAVTTSLSEIILLFVRYTYVYLLLFNWSQCPVETVNNVNFVVTQNAIQAATPITAAGLPEQSENEVVLGCEEFQLKLAVWTTEPSTNTTGIYGEQMIRSYLSLQMTLWTLLNPA